MVDLEICCDCFVFGDVFLFFGGFLFVFEVEGDMSLMMVDFEFVDVILLLCVLFLLFFIVIGFDVFELVVVVFVENMGLVDLVLCFVWQGDFIICCMMVQIVLLLVICVWVVNGCVFVGWLLLLNDLFFDCVLDVICEEFGWDWMVECFVGISVMLWLIFVECFCIVVGCFFVDYVIEVCIDVVKWMLDVG